MAIKYNWDKWDNFDDFRTDDTCPDIMDSTTPPTTGGSTTAPVDDGIRFDYYLPGSAEDMALPRVSPRIESVEIVHTIHLVVRTWPNHV
jgi:hypothetical protein